MEHVQIKITYVIKSDLLKMLLILIEQLKEGNSVIIDISSNIGGELNYQKLIEELN